MGERTIHSADYSQPKQEKYINPYTDFGFQKLFDQAEIARYSESERRQYEESRKDYWDYYSTVTTAEKKGRAEGLAEGMEKGLAEGMEKGLAEGMEEGQQQEKVETVRRLQAMGLTVEQIAQGVELTIDEVKTLLS